MTGKTDASLNHIRPTFVVGAARSGTTWVQCLLSAQEGFRSCAETHFFDELMVSGPVCGGYQLHRPRRQYRGDTLGMRELRESLEKADSGFLRVGDDTRENLAQLADAGRLQKSTYLDVLMQTCAGVADARNSPAGWVEKTPIHISYLRALFAVFPAARVVCVVRDPADVLRSAVKTFGIPASIAALDYWRSYRDLNIFLQSAPKHRGDVHVVSYEKLVRSDDELEALFRFLDVPAVEPGHLRTRARELFDRLYGNTVMRDIQPGMHQTRNKDKGAASEAKGLAISGLAWWLAGNALQGVTTSYTAKAPGTKVIPAAIWDIVIGLGYFTYWRIRCLTSCIRYRIRQHHFEHSWTPQ